MRAKGLNLKGSVFLSEYVSIFFIAVAVVTAMSVYFQRSLQARMRDARHYMADTLRGQCQDANCLKATGGEIGDHYEPYYIQTTSNIAREDFSQKGLVAAQLGSAGIFVGFTQSNTQGDSQGVQLAPAEAK